MQYKTREKNEICKMKIMKLDMCKMCTTFTIIGFVLACFVKYIFQLIHHIRFTGSDNVNVTFAAPHAAC